MQRQEITLGNTELKTLIQEACTALAQLDAGRLEELALSCRALNRSEVPVRRTEKDARSLYAELSVLEGILKATKANLDVLRRILRMRETQSAYDPRRFSTHTVNRENPYGDN
jgi:DNA gyrase/topoisomerase IV subunit A